MESIIIDIINPKAKQLLKNLADLDLIRIKEEKDKSDFYKLVEKLRENAEDVPPMDDITEAVEAVRKSRYED